MLQAEQTAVHHTQPGTQNISEATVEKLTFTLYSLFSELVFGSFGSTVRQNVLCCNT